MIKYKTDEWRGEPGARILKIECERETDKCIWIGKNRHLKITESERYFDTWQEAHEYILEMAKDKVNHVKVQLDKAKGLLGNIKGMKEEL